MLIGTNILHNLSHLVYFKNLHEMREAVIMASEMTFSIFKISLPHPLIALRYADYRLREIMINENIFEDESVLDPSETMLSLEKISWMLMDFDLPIKAIPILTLMDYIATDLL